MTCKQWNDELPSGRWERGYGLLDLMVATAIGTGVLLVASSSFGMAAPSVHPAALALQSALVEARSIATMQQADGTDGGLPTGATVSVATDASMNGHSIISVFRSRPIVNPNLSLTGAQTTTANLPRDMGFPQQVVPAIFTVNQLGEAPETGTFSILVSSAGYSSIIAGYAYQHGSTLLASDPSCSEAGTSIIASWGEQTETHAFDCRDATYEASAPG